MTNKGFNFNVFLQVIDGVFTYCGVKYITGDSSIEGNPIIRHLIDEFGAFDALFWAKTFAILILCLFHHLIYKPNKRKFSILYWVVGTVYTISAFLWVAIFIQHFLV
jgi:hypothetical protein